MNAPIFKPLTSSMHIPGIGMGRKPLWVPTIAIGTGQTVSWPFVPEGKTFATQKEAMAEATRHAQHLNEYLALNGFK